jgi:hypothetical protein
MYHVERLEVLPKRMRRVDESARRESICGQQVGGFVVTARDWQPCHGVDSGCNDERENGQPQTAQCRSGQQAIRPGQVQLLAPGLGSLVSPERRNCPSRHE